MVSRSQDKPHWLTAVQPTIGKLYVLSLFYLMCVASISPAPRTISDFVSRNARPLQQPDERPTALISTLTVPREAGTTLTQGSRVPVEGDECSEIAVADYGHEKTVGFAV
jgi:hypothetical protein